MRDVVRDELEEQARFDELKQGILGIEALDHAERRLVEDNWERIKDLIEDYDLSQEDIAALSPILQSRFEEEKINEVISEMETFVANEETRSRVDDIKENLQNTFQELLGSAEDIFGAGMVALFLEGLMEWAPIRTMVRPMLRELRIKELKEVLDNMEVGYDLSEEDMAKLVSEFHASRGVGMDDPPEEQGEHTESLEAYIRNLIENSTDPPEDGADWEINNFLTQEQQEAAERRIEEQAEQDALAMLQGMSIAEQMELMQNGLQDSRYNALKETVLGTVDDDAENAAELRAKLSEDLAEIRDELSTTMQETIENTLPARLGLADIATIDFDESASDRIIIDYEKDGTSQQYTIEDDSGMWSIESPDVDGDPVTESEIDELGDRMNTDFEAKLEQAEGGSAPAREPGAAGGPDGPPEPVDDERRSTRDPEELE